MKKISIRPILDFIASQHRNYLTAGDWAQLEAKIKNQIARKESRGEDITKEETI